MTDIIEDWEDISENSYKYSNRYGDVYYYSKKIRDDKYVNRKDGPAVEYANGYKRWYTYGKHNRIDGPAIECPDGYGLWYLQHIEYSKTEYFLIIL